MSEHDEPAAGECCESTVERDLYNRPGLPAVQWRLGTHGTFMARMTSALPKTELAEGTHAGERPLARLTTRDPADASIAMLDAGAVVCDVLSFYNERIANEGYLRTATERRSVLELARQIGYELNPGVAASTFLAITVEDPPPPPAPSFDLPAPPPPILIPSTITVPVGTQVQSIPGQGELPQTFETTQPLQARVAYNRVRPRQTQRQQLGVSGGQLRVWNADASGTSVVCEALWLATSATGISPGDVLVVHVTDGHVAPADPVSAMTTAGLVALLVETVDADPEHDRTRVRIRQIGAKPTPPYALPPRADGVVELAPVTLDTAAVRDRIVDAAWDETALSALISIQHWDEDEVVDKVAAFIDDAPAAAHVYAFRDEVAPFGAAAPAWAAVEAQQPGLWPDYEGATVWKTSDGTFHSADGGPDLYLERPIDKLVAGSLLGLATPGDALPELFSIGGVVRAALADFAISAQATGLSVVEVSDPTRPIVEWTSRIGDAFKTGTGAKYGMRATRAFVRAEALPLAPAPIEDPVATAVALGSGATRYEPTSQVVLDRLVLGLEAGRVVAIEGATLEADGRATGLRAREVATIERVVHSGGTTVLHFAAALEHRYVRDSMTLCANVARASHGESQPVATMPNAAGMDQETLGSGDGTRANQTFSIGRPPLTYVSAPTPTGAATTLEVRVDGVAWTEVDTLFGQDGNAKVYTVRIADDGTTTVRFGDGIAGARLPTGVDNVTARYRTGIGVAAEVGEGRLTLLRTRPLGLKSVVNPVAATGASDPESRDEARSNAPLTVRTLDRIVSLSDYRDFARSFAGIGKAIATPVWSGDHKVVHITVGSASGSTVDPDSDLFRNLSNAVSAVSDGGVPVVLAGYAPRFFALGTAVIVDDAYDADVVLAAVRTALEDAYRYERRHFAQPVTESEVVALVHDVEGVAAATVTALHYIDTAVGKASALASAPARFDAGPRTIVPAELVLLAPTGLIVTGAST